MKNTNWRRLLPLEKISLPAKKTATLSLSLSLSLSLCGKKSRAGQTGAAMRRGKGMSDHLLHHTISHKSGLSPHGRPGGSPAFCLFLPVCARSGRRLRKRHTVLSIFIGIKKRKISFPEHQAHNFFEIKRDRLT